MTNVTSEYVAEIIDKFEVSDENKRRGVLGIEGNILVSSSPLRASLTNLHAADHFLSSCCLLWFYCMKHFVSEHQNDSNCKAKCFFEPILSGESHAK